MKVDERIVVLGLWLVIVIAPIALFLASASGFLAITPLGTIDQGGDGLRGAWDSSFFAGSWLLLWLVLPIARVLYRALKKLRGPV